MKSANAFGLLCLGVALVSGCSKEDTSMTPPPPPPPPNGGAGAVDMSAAPATPPPSAPPVVAPPPTGAEAAMPATPAGPEAEPKEFKDPDGKTISLMQHMEVLVQGYERTRASQASSPDQTQWPPLTDLNQLVNVRMITRLPAAPAGQKFVYDPQTGKVSLAPK